MQQWDCAPAGYKPGHVSVIAAKPLDTTLRLKRKRLPALELRNSYIPEAGLGLFAAERIPKNALITEYGGRIVDRSEAERLRRAKQDTHLRALTLGREAIDARIQPPTFTRDYYVKNHQAGGFVNQGRKEERNAIYINERGNGAVQPSGQIASDRVFLKATKDIEPGCEILTSYQQTYGKLHLKS